jgi:hypothetical protein
MGGARISEEVEDDASYRRLTGQGEKGGDFDLAEEEPFSASLWSPLETRGTVM